MTGAREAVGWGRGGQLWLEEAVQEGELLGDKGGERHRAPRGEAAKLS